MRFMSYEFAYLSARTLTMKEVREVYGLSQNEVAKILDCTQSKVSKIDNRLVSLEHLATISESFGHIVHISLTETKSKG